MLVEIGTSSGNANFEKRNTGNEVVAIMKHTIFQQIEHIFGKHPEIPEIKKHSAEDARGAGVLLHITSLPGDYGIGDLGKEAFHFADMLDKCRQRYWQILPLNPLGFGDSPYSSFSAFGGNPLLINPDKLAKDELLDPSWLNQFRVKESSQVDYLTAKKVKQQIFDRAYTNFLHNEHPHLDEAFKGFCNHEQHWLNDHALYVAIKNYYPTSWDQWPEEYKYQYPEDIEQFVNENWHEIEKEKFLQFLFHRQWIDLKTYCNQKGISIIGDLPLYISYDSVDVWMHPEYFKMDENKQPTGVAGVPPDYFSQTGQLWGMPVFNWAKIKEEGFEWWINRVQRNLQLVDQLRIDHFRGFSSYWEIPSNETSAVNGHWEPGPAYEFFNVLGERLEGLPIIAEDLGEIDQPVYDLRDHYQLPGMKVLQFAFGDDMPHTIHAPHNHTRNFVVYTATHDNNTTKGWFRNLDKATRKRIQLYLGKKITAANCHQELIRLAYASVANTAIVPMQDLLGLGEEAIMNRPSYAEGNWKWKLTKAYKQQMPVSFLIHLINIYNR